MADNSYPLEIKLAPKAVWFTPAEARNYYGRYGRDGITIHWWGDGTGASNHDNIVNYFLRRTDGSVNYVLSDNKITMMVNPDNVAWTSQSGNATTVSIEHQPTLGAEGYKKSGWLVNQLEQRYGKRLALYPHNYWAQTACPGSISLDRIRQEADKWARGEYDAPAPVPTPTPPAKADIQFTQFSEGTRKFVLNKNTSLWNFDAVTWGAITSVKPFNAGEEVDIKGYAVNKTLGGTYFLTPYSFDKRIPNGFNQVDLALKQQPVPPVVVPPVQPPAPEKPEWEKNLRDVDDTEFWFTKDTDLVDITKGTPTGTKSFKKDESFVASALTVSAGVEYRITDYSFKKGIFNGVPISNLTLTKPGVPDVPPVPEVPVEPEPTPNPVPDKNAIIAFLEGIVVAIVAFIKKLKGDK